ncbi:hypothetical protein B0G80_7345 [Paraburkholderia sp. BL6669N2]|uniref:hypothetical protein n=1 Tax=Paraburkholderia sp. BL6669N2 TaxID=1938807 RepID=UPI000E288B31|nr:hypothetical protein [Paraburkholderia sp. BL6669N2]REG50880.1 hypothetical protein B0G80_7345 [Paraburkholderia sp. BL6669N2]
MRTTEYHLYRIKFIKPAQVALFDPGITPRELFELGLAARPSLEIKYKNTWHIGNVEYLTDDAGRFAVGRITRTTVEKFDENSKNFQEVADDSGPYTFVYFDAALGLLGIGRKARVANDVASIAQKIEKLMQATPLVIENEIHVKVDKIRDPRSFVQKINSCISVKKFKANFTGPNPIDADELFQKPMSYFCQQIDGEQGSVAVSGSALNPEAVIAIAKSTAATGNMASAAIQEERGKAPVTVSIRGDARKVAVEGVATKESTLDQIRRAYAEVRE